MSRNRLYLAFVFLAAVLLASSVVALFRASAPPSTWFGHVLPSFPDYAPSGMPDFDEKQDSWGPVAGEYTWCGPVAVANALWWYDSEFESRMNRRPVAPPTISDNCPLVAALGGWDDHDPQNAAPLVNYLATLMDTDGMVSGDHHIGTRWTDLVNGTETYMRALASKGWGLGVLSVSFPTFNLIINDGINVWVEKNYAVILWLDFWKWDNSMWIPFYGNVSFEFGHDVTCAGANANLGEVLISDPYQDAFEAGTAPRGGQEPVEHPVGHDSTVHNDTQYVSHDAYQVFLNQTTPLANPYHYPVCELVDYLQTMGFDPSYHAFIPAALVLYSDVGGGGGGVFGVGGAGHMPFADCVLVGSAMSIDEFGLLAPYTGVAIVVFVGMVATSLWVKRAKRGQKKQ